MVQNTVVVEKELVRHVIKAFHKRYSLLSMIERSECAVMVFINRSDMNKSFHDLCLVSAIHNITG